MNTKSKNVTEKTYASLMAAYDHFNRELFNGTLPFCMITLQRKSKAYGYFAPQRFKHGKQDTDEIALNPSMLHLGNRETFSTLAHEMAHLWQQHFGKPSRNGYHNAQWGVKMKEIGLYPSSTGQPGGKEKGQKVSHYIVKGGAFDIANAKFKCEPLIIENWDEQKKKNKKSNKSKYECGCGTRAWAKPQTSLICGECHAEMDEYPPETDDE